MYGSFPKIRATILGVPFRRVRVFWGLDWGPVILGSYHMEVAHEGRLLETPLIRTVEDVRRSLRTM